MKYCMPAPWQPEPEANTWPRIELCSGSGKVNSPTMAYVLNGTRVANLTSNESSSKEYVPPSIAPSQHQDIAPISMLN